MASVTSSDDASRAVVLDAAPWCVLLSADLPLEHQWTPAGMLRLRGTCKALRGGVSSGEYFARLLRQLGVRRIDGLEQRAAAHRIFTLCCTVWAERQFVHVATAACRRVAGLGPNDVAPCVVAGGLALHRQMLLSSEGDDITWRPGDLDIFVSGCRRPWTDAELQAHRDEELRNEGGEERDVGAHGMIYPMPRPLSAHGATTNPAVKTVVRLAMAMLGGLYPDSHVYVEAREGYVHWNENGHGVSTTEYSRAAVVRALETEAPKVVPAVGAASTGAWCGAIASQLPAAGGGPVNARPVQLGTIIEVSLDEPALEPRVKKSFAPRLRDFAGLGYLSGWWAPAKINIIELVSEEPIPPLQVVSGFDMLQCGVAMVPRGPSGVEFVQSEETRQCVRRREVRLTRYVLGPLKLHAGVEGPEMSPEDALRRIVYGLMDRALKYMRRGFALVDTGAGTRIEAPEHPRVRAFDDALAARTPLDRLVIDVPEEYRSGRWVVSQLCRLLAPVVRRSQPHEDHYDIASFDRPSEKKSRLACVSPTELSQSIERLLRGGLLIACRLPDGEERRDNDGFPLLLCTRARTRFEGPLGFHDLVAEQADLALTHGYAEDVPDEHLPLTALPNLPDIVRSNFLDWPAPS